MSLCQGGGKERKQKLGEVHCGLINAAVNFLTITSSRFGVLDVEGSGPGRMIVNGNMRVCSSAVCGGERAVITETIQSEPGIGSAPISAALLCASLLS